MINYVIGDLHLGHRRICEFEPEHRPFTSVDEHDREIIARWNAQVTDDDRVYLLGDVFFRRENLEKARQLKGRKILILGNHDVYAPMAVYEEVFEKIYGALTYGPCLMTHVPCHTSQLEYRYKLNIHGHVHSRSLPDRRYVNVSAEALGLIPAMLDPLIQARVKEIAAEI